MISFNNKEIVWTQRSWLEESTIIDFKAIEGDSLMPSGNDKGNSEFKGLGKSTQDSIEQKLSNLKTPLHLKHPKNHQQINNLNLEKYYDLFIERAAIYEYEADLSKEEAEKKALNDISTNYAEDKGLNPNSLEISNFINQLTIN